jgi:anti-sigma B factor antagonist
MRCEDASRLTNYANGMGHGMRTRVAHEQDLLNALSHRRCREDPMAIVEDRKIQLTQTEERLHSAIPRSLARNAEGLKRASERLAAIGEGLIRPHVQDDTRMGGRLDSVGPTLVRPFERDTERLGGRLDTPAAQDAAPEMNALKEDASGTIILDCADLSYISSSGLRLFLVLRKEATEKGGKVIVRNITDSIRSVFMMTGFLNLFEIQ